MNCWLLRVQRNEEVPLIRGSMEECINTRGEGRIYLTAIKQKPRGSWKRYKLSSLFKCPGCFPKLWWLWMVSHFCCLSPACTSITGPVFIICWTSNVIVIKLPNGALSTEILHFTCGVSCCLDFCLTATFLQHSPQAGSQHIPAWAFNSIIVCAKRPYGNCYFLISWVGHFAD